MLEYISDVEYHIISSVGLGVIAFFVYYFMEKFSLKESIIAASIVGIGILILKLIEPLLFDLIL